VKQKLVAVLPGHEIARLAVTAEVHPRTVRRVLLGLPTKPIVRARIERVLRAKGISIPAGGEA
jgi:hypothetical protein